MSIMWALGRCLKHAALCPSTKLQMGGGIDAYCDLYEPYYRGRYESIDYRSGGKARRAEVFTPVQPTRRRPGTGSVSQINDHLWEGRYSPVWPDGKKRPRNVYAPTEEECEEKLEELIREMNAEIEALSDEVRAEFRKAGVVRENREDCAQSTVFPVYRV